MCSDKSTKNRKNLITRVDDNLKVYLSAGPSPTQENSFRSTPDSLEWDRELVKSDSLGSLDYETKELLNEIEQLKNRVLSETGDGLVESWQTAKNVWWQQREDHKNIVKNIFMISPSTTQPQPLISLYVLSNYLLSNDGVAYKSP